jgi:hypothetical protein
MLVLTTFQAFLGAVTIALSLFRGGESTLSTHHHTLLAQANHAAALLGQYHARSANAITTNNTICAGLLGPRFSVEADNISMDESAMVACPRNDPYHRKVCARYKANKPRAATKLAWIRSQQTTICRALSQLSAGLDGVMSERAMDLARSSAEVAIEGVTFELENAAQTAAPWGKSSFEQACKLAAEDAQGSNMVGHAFPLLMHLMVPGLPQALVERAPSLFCALKSGSPIRLPEVPSVAQSSREQCRDLEQRTRWAAVPASSDTTAISGSNWRTMADLPEAARPFVECRRIAELPAAAITVEDGGGLSYSRDPDPGFYLLDDDHTSLRCNFDQDSCFDDALVDHSRRFVTSLQLPSLTGGETRAPSVDHWNHADEFRVRVSAARRIDDFTQRVSDAIRTIASFGSAGATDTLRKDRRYTACARWYFADGPTSAFAGVEPARQSFVQGWSHALTSCR